MQLFFDFGGAPDVVQDMHHRFRGGFDDICRQTHTVEAATVIIDDDIHLTQGVFTVPFSRQVVFHQLYVVLSDAVNRLVNGIHRAVAVGGFRFNFIPAGQLHGGGGDVA